MESYYLFCFCQEASFILTAQEIEQGKTNRDMADLRQDYLKKNTKKLMKYEMLQCEWRGNSKTNDRINLHPRTHFSLQKIGFYSRPFVLLCSVPSSCSR